MLGLIPSASGALSGNISVEQEMQAEIYARGPIACQMHTDKIFDAYRGGVMMNRPWKEITHIITVRYVCVYNFYYDAYVCLLSAFARACACVRYIPIIYDSLMMDRPGRISHTSSLMCMRCVLANACVHTRCYFLVNEQTTTKKGVNTLS